MEARATIDITAANGRVDFTIRDTAGAIIWDAVGTATDLMDGALHHLLIRLDISGGAGNEVGECWIDGALEPLTESTAPTFNGNPIDHFNGGSYGILSHNTGVLVLNAQVADLFIDLTAAHAYTDFFDGGGNPKDIIALGAPAIFLGANMTADERGGNGAQGQNDECNLGSAVTSVTGTFADV